jgi:hypothetical protein
MNKYKITILVESKQIATFQIMAETKKEAMKRAKERFSTMYKYNVEQIEPELGKFVESFDV